MMTLDSAAATPFGCAGVAWLLLRGTIDAAKAAGRAVKRVPRALSRLVAGIAFAWDSAAASLAARAARKRPVVSVPLPPPGPFEPAPRPADTTQSMTPMGPDTALHATLPYIPPPDDEERP
jgi:hypothetical protein